MIIIFSLIEVQWFFVVMFCHGKLFLFKILSSQKLILVAQILTEVIVAFELFESEYFIFQFFQINQTITWK